MLGYLFLSLKRAVRTVYFPVMLVIFAAAIYFAPAIGEEEGLPPAGLCCFDGSEISVRITEYLCENGYEMCENEEILREKVSSGEYSCGAVIPDGLGELVAKGRPDGAVKFIVTPISYAPELYKNHIAAAVYRECAPYITAEALADTVITFEDVYEEYSEMTEAGAYFTFNEQLSDADVSYEKEREKTYTLAAISLLVFALMMYSASDTLRGDIMPLSHRIGSGKAVLFSVLPDISVRIAGIVSAYAIAAFMRGKIAEDDVLTELFSAVALYTVLVSAFAVFAVTLFAGVTRTSAFTFYMLVISLLLCPIYLDVALVLPVISPLRVLVPPYWLWMLDGAESHALCAVIATAAFALALGFMALRFRHKRYEKA